MTSIDLRKTYQDHYRAADDPAWWRCRHAPT